LVLTNPIGPLKFVCYKQDLVYLGIADFVKADRRKILRPTQVLMPEGY
jgi:hypothetical protein